MINYQEQGSVPMQSSSKETILIPDDAERVELGGFVAEIADFYHLGPEVIRKGLGTQAFIVSKRQLVEIALIKARNLCRDHPEMKSELDQDIADLERNKVDYGNLFVPFAEDRNLILLTRDYNVDEIYRRRNIRHELIHAMSNHRKPLETPPSFRAGRKTVMAQNRSGKMCRWDLRHIAIM